MSLTREEAYLAAMAGDDVDITGMKPLTREEAYLAAAAGAEVDVSALEPLTRKEAFLARIAEGGGGGSTLPAWEGGSY